MLPWNRTALPLLRRWTLKSGLGLVPGLGIGLALALSLTCGGGGGGGSNSTPPPTVSVSLSPTAKTLTTGQTQTFTASVTGSSNTSVVWSIQEGSGGGTIDNAGHYTAPGTPTTAHVVATSQADLGKSATATVTVVAAPAITGFTASPGTIASGSSSTLTATFSGGTASVDHGVGVVNSGAGVLVSPAATTTYTLTVTNTAGTAVTATATVTVQSPPSITSFAAAPATITSGSSAILNWTVTGATSLSLDNGIGDVSGATSHPVTPGATTTYTLTATNAFGSVNATATVTVVPPPAITSFSANPTSVVSGATTQLSATFSGGTGVVTPGNLAITSGTPITSNPIATTTTFTLTVTNPAGTSTTQTTTVSLILPPPPPAGASAAPGDSAVTVSWNPATGAASYNLYRASSTGVTKGNYASLPNGAKVTGALSPYTDTGLTNGTTYYYVVTAVNAAGESAESSESSATPQAGLGGPQRLAISSGIPAAPTAGTPYSFTFTAAGGTPPYTWSGAILAPDSTSNGLTLDSSTGVYAGTPKLAGPLPLKITVSDSAFTSATAQYELMIGGSGSPQAILTSPPAGIEGGAYQVHFDTSWSSQLGCDPNLLLIEGSIPPGLTLNQLSGDLGNPPAASGTPVAAGDWTFTMSASTNNLCSPAPAVTNAQTFTIHIAPAGLSPRGSSGWLRAGGAPELTPVAGWEDEYVTSPSVIKVGSTYLMYYEGRDTATHTAQIGLATSADGSTWTRSASNPVLPVGAPGAWDGFEVRCPVVHYDGTTYRMWYLGKNSLAGAAGQFSAMIGLATSADGVHWTRQASPVFGTAFGGTGYIPGTVIQSGGQFVMWYSDAFGAIGRATSPDGITWTDTGTVLSGGHPGRPSVLLDGATYRMWFNKSNSFGSGITGGASLTNLNIGSASSPDGITWTTHDYSPSVCFFCVDTDDPHLPALAMGAGGAWDRPGVGQPSVILDGPGFRMWYAGGVILTPGNGSLDSAAYVAGAIGEAHTP
ncbi:MAG TPA: putative Ig domain-containing protein [Holophagaceae bacterium]|nr:putative Ig domain-containing protein [Holophagaceae bacterium]